MQVNATLIAAQQAAREAQARFQQAHIPPKSPAAAPQASFAAALDDDIFKPLPLKQNAAPQTAAPANAPSPAARPGSQLDITI